MSTIRAIVDRLYRDWLDPSGNSMLSVPITSTVTAGATELVHDDGYLRPNEQDLLDQGTRIEANLEIMRASAYDATTRTVTISRSQLGSTVAEHAAGDYLYIAPDISMLSVFDAVADAIEDLFPELWAVKTKQFVTSSSWVELADEHAVMALRGVAEDCGIWVSCPVAVVRGIPASSTGVILQMPTDVTTGLSGYVTYQAKFVRPTALTDTFTAVGIEESWVQPIIVGALMGLVMRQDLDATTVELISNALDQAGFPVGEGESLNIAMRRWHRALVDAKKAGLHQQWGIAYERDGFVQ